MLSIHLFWWWICGIYSSSLFPILFEVKKYFSVTTMKSMIMYALMIIFHVIFSMAFYSF